MGKHFTLALRIPSYKARNPERVKKGNGITLEDGKIGYFVLILLVGLVVNYLVQVNSFATKGYEIRGLQKEIAKLKESQKQLELEAAQLQSLQRISTELQSYMVPVTNVNYAHTTALTQR